MRGGSCECYQDDVTLFKNVRRQFFSNLLGEILGEIRPPPRPSPSKSGRWVGEGIAIRARYGAMNTLLCRPISPVALSLASTVTSIEPDFTCAAGCLANTR